jgi:hypothetical protein
VGQALAEALQVARPARQVLAEALRGARQALAEAVQVGQLLVAQAPVRRAPAHGVMLLPATCLRPHPGPRRPTLPVA